MINAFDQTDAQIIGYTATTEDILSENERKKRYSMLKAGEVIVKQENDRLALFIEGIKNIIPSDRILTDNLSRYVFANDASHYLLIPKVVIKVSNELEVKTILKFASQYKLPVTFRAAGTSLSGQALSDSVLLVTDENWRGYQVSEDAHSIRLQPGLTGGEANLFLAPFSRKIGPDPASIASAKIGGIAANNASGMCCGVKNNSYHTLKGLRIIFSDGTILDTEDQSSVAQFKHQKQKWLQEILNIKQDIINDPGLSHAIHSRYQIKNTVGYCLNAFLDFEDPIEIIAHLMIGSEGTLGFMSAISYYTLPSDPFEAVSLAFYPSIEAACDAAMQLQGQSVDAVELMDGIALSTAKNNPNIELPSQLNLHMAALLMDVKASSSLELNQKTASLNTLIQSTRPILFSGFLSDRMQYQAIWDMRKGILPSIAALRTPGSLMLNEDVAVHPHKLKAFCVDLKKLFETHGYPNASLFGHVKDGNLHFLLEERFTESLGIERYDRFMQALANLVIHQYQGSLKAEHGVGRNMAPFVKTAIGEKAYEILWRIKKLLDPARILNPDVILTDDNTLHLKHLKQIPQKDPLIDRCIECGFCERMCPSKDLTLTPRQRIIAWRNQESLEKTPDFDYRFDQTCAATGLCSMACPVKINTGDLVKKVRAQRQNRSSTWIASLIAKYYGLALSSLKTLIFLKRHLSKKSSDSFGIDHSKHRSLENELGKTVIYFESCPTRLFRSTQKRKMLEHIFGLLDTQIIFVNHKWRNALCCGLSFENKGFPSLALKKSQALENALSQLSHQGNIPILSDTGSCTCQFNQRKNQQNSLKMIDLIEFFFQHLDKLPIQRREKTIVLHIPCGIKKLGLGEKMQRIAQACATKVIIPNGIECCGFAGDKGFTVPNLNASALKRLRKQIPADCTEGYSAHPTCEIGLSQHSGISYQSILDLLYDSVI